jgi:hypothetical protein
MMLPLLLLMGLGAFLQWIIVIVMAIAMTISTIVIVAYDIHSNIGRRNIETCHIFSPIVIVIAGTAAFAAISSRLPHFTVSK